MNDQTTDRLGICMSSPPKSVHLARSRAVANVRVDFGGGRHDHVRRCVCGDAIRRMRIDREGILDMLVKGRGSGL